MPLQESGCGGLQVHRRLPLLTSPSPCLLPRPCPAGLLSDNNRLTELSRIVGKFEEIAADQRGEVKAVVTTAEVRASG